MSDGTPEYMIPREIEPRKFAQLGVLLKGGVPAQALPRLAQATLAVESVEAQLQFSLNEQSRAQVQGTVDARVQQQCQRCLEPVEVVLSCSVALTVTKSEQQAKDLAKELDAWLVPDDSGDLFAMLEEEILLALPYVVFHDYDCVDASLFQRGPASEASPEKAGNPFQVLEQLKKARKD